MASSGPQADYHKPKRPTGSGMAGVCVDGGVAHRWRRSAYVTCLVFMPCSKFFAKASADNCSIQERGSFLFFFLLLSFFCLLLGCSFGAVSSSGPGAASCGRCSPTVCPTVRPTVRTTVRQALCARVIWRQAPSFVLPTHFARFPAVILFSFVLHNFLFLFLFLFFSSLFFVRQPSANYRAEKATSDKLNFPKHTGIREASLLLVKEKCGRYTLTREPLYLDRCVVCSEADWDDYFEVQEISSKDTFIFKVSRRQLA